VTNCEYFLSSIINPNLYISLGGLLLAGFVWGFWRYTSKIESPASIGKKISYLGVLFVVAGAVLNLTERFKSGCVGDPLNFFGLFYYNINDLSVTFGLLLLMIGLYYLKRVKNFKVQK